MRRLFDKIQNLVSEEKYVIGQHASERLEERDIMEWQVVAGLADGELIAEKLDATPNLPWRCENACQMAQSSKRFGLIFLKVMSPSW